jgi:hypothetical protein
MFNTGFPHASGAYVEELGREAQRGVRFRRLCGLGPQEGWLKAPGEQGT